MRAFNFGPGPASLPTSVLERARDELTDWGGSGMSAMELSHRSPEFLGITARAEQNFRTLLEIPDDYAVLFVQGGATSQFAAVPLNLASAGDRADYVRTGYWSAKAVTEAGRFVDVNIAADASGNNYTDIPDEKNWQLSDNAAYLHYTPNETIHGVEFNYVPSAGNTPLVADMSSNILSRPIDVSQFAVIYAGAQKNIGPAGITIVIVREEFLGRARGYTPSTLDYETTVRAESMFNTPPTFTWYMAGLVFEWLMEQGGVAAMAKRNRRKAGKLYDQIDNSDFYSNPVNQSCRSLMNVPFTLADDKLDSRFLELAVADGLTNLKGHRAVGGMRASIYNAMPEEGVDALIAFMQEFERQHA